MLVTLAAILVVALLGCLLIVQRNRARAKRGALLRAIEAEARGEEAAASPAGGRAAGSARSDQGEEPAGREAGTRRAG